MTRDDDDHFDNIRDPELLGSFIGRRLVDVTQTDVDELQRGEPNEVMLHFDNGATVSFRVESGFWLQAGNE